MELRKYYSRTLIIEAKCDMQYPEYKIGFDARQERHHVNEWWPDHRREAFLYRIDAPEPLSVDEKVWPRYLSYVAGNAIGKWRGRYNHLWDELNILKHHADEGMRETMRGYELISITLVAHAPESAQLWFTTHGSELADMHLCEPALDSSLQFLGFDIADAWGVSGLLNCGFLIGVDDVKGYRERWAHSLNRHHLFEDLDEADRFRIFVDGRIKEHAPFYIFALYSVNLADQGTQ